MPITVTLPLFSLLDDEHQSKLLGAPKKKNHCVVKKATRRTEDPLFFLDIIKLEFDTWSYCCSSFAARVKTNHYMEKG